MNIYFILYLLLIVAPIGTIIHETGHLIGAIIVKADRISISIGLGKKIGTYSFRNVTINIHTLFFLGGYVQSQRKASYETSEVVWITIFGPINNAVFAMIFYFMNEIYVHPYIQILFLFNLWLAVVNIIPFKIRGKQSDGYMILKAILKRDTLFK